MSHQTKKAALATRPSPNVFSSPPAETFTAKSPSDASRADRDRRGRSRLLDPTTGLAVYDGVVLVAAITFAEGKHHLFDPSGRWLGSFPSQQAAMRAAPALRGSTEP